VDVSHSTTPSRYVIICKPVAGVHTQAPQHLGATRCRVLQYSSTRHLTKHILYPTTAQSSHIIASRWYERAQRTKSIMTSPGHAASREAAMSQSLSIPAGRPNLACCCGRTSCAYLSHNNAALDDLEKDLRTAAQLGQVCSLWNPAVAYFICALPCSLDSHLWHFL